MKYTGTINEADATRYGLPRRAVFVPSGCWSVGGRSVTSYKLDESEEAERARGLLLQFSRTRRNVFYIETVDKFY